MVGLVVDTDELDAVEAVVPADVAVSAVEVSEPPHPASAMSPASNQVALGARRRD
jgi:hypothetical protein